MLLWVISLIFFSDVRVVLCDVIIRSADNKPPDNRTLLRSTPSPRIPECETIHRENNSCPPGFPCVQGECHYTLRHRPFSLNPERELYCSCDRGWVGHMCEDCCGLECYNNGTCVLDGMTKEPLCHCKWGFTGELCEGVATTTANPVMQGAKAQSECLLLSKNIRPYYTQIITWHTFQ